MPAPATTVAEVAAPTAPAVARPGWRRRLDLLAALTASDLRIRYGRGRVRTLKWLLDPIAAVGVYLLLVEFVLDRPGGGWALSLACAVFPFQLVMMSIINAMGAVRQRAPIISNMAFPRSLLPISSAVTESIAFAGSLIVLAIMMAAYGVAPEAAVLWLPVVVAMTIVFAAACAYPASLIGLWFREFQNIVISGVRALFFLASGLVALNQVGGGARELLPFNPLTGIFEAYRRVLIAGEAPEWWHIAYPLAFAAALLVVFVPIYRREAPHFAKVSEE